MNGQQHFAVLHCEEKFHPNPSKIYALPVNMTHARTHEHLSAKGLCMHKRGCYGSRQKPAGLSKVHNYIVDVLAPHFLGRLAGGSSAAIWPATFLTLEI